MEGIDDVELQMDPSGLIPDVNAAANLASDLSAAGLISQTKLVAAVPGGGQPLNDYDPLWLIKAHPSCFPWGTGGPPEGMSLIRWIRGTINRYPREQFAQNVGFLTDSFNIWQRHETYTHASVQLKLSPHLAAQIQHLTEDDICAVLKLLAGGSNGKDYTKAFGALPPAARVLLDGLKRTGARVLGSPQSFLSLRSKVIAGNVIFGSYTCMMNLCPSEISSEWTFRLSGKEFNFDMFGNPANPRPVIESLRCVAANPKSCAHFAHAYMQSFAKVFLGWPMDSPCQIDPNCLFGQILMAYLKYEVSGRFAKHAHGQITQPALQAKHILLMMENGDFQKLLLNFMESFSMSYTDECPASPAPGYDDDNTAVDLTTTADGKFCAVGPKANFLARHDALSDWSFVETEMAYDCGVIRSQHARMLALQGDHPKAGLYGHSARTAAAMCLPQFIREFPLMPAEQAPPDEREAWAAFALGAFFPYDRKLSVLQGSSLWEKVAFWRANKPRGDFDTFAWRCLDNIQERSCTVLAPN